MDTTFTERTERPTLRASYDSHVDVFHLASGRQEDVEGEGLPGGLELDFSVESGRPCGVTVIGYVRNGWAHRVGELAEIAGRHLSIDSRKIINLIDRETRNRG